MIAIFHPLSSILNHFDMAFSAACPLVHFVTQLLGNFPGDSWVSHFFEGNFFAGELAQQLCTERVG
jgi:hypothetical protein